MAYSNLRDVLERLRDVHVRLSAAYVAARDRAREERARLLLDEMWRQERRMAERFQGYLADDQLDAAGAWIQYTPELELEQAIETLDLTPARSAEEIFDQAMRVEGRVRRLHERLRTTSGAPRIRELFGALIAEHGFGLHAPLFGAA